MPDPSLHRTRTSEDLGRQAPGGSDSGTPQAQTSDPPTKLRWKLWRMTVDSTWHMGDPDPFYAPDAVETVELVRVEEVQKAYWSGAYEELQRLSRSPRFNRPQLALIMDEAAMVREKASAAGVKFTGPEPDRPDLEKYR